MAYITAGLLRFRRWSLQRLSNPYISAFTPDDNELFLSIPLNEIFGSSPFGIALGDSTASGVGGSNYVVGTVNANSTAVGYTFCIATMLGNSTANGIGASIA